MSYSGLVVVAKNGYVSCPYPRRGVASGKGDEAMEKDRVDEPTTARRPRGIVISDGRQVPTGPRIAAFIWGGRVRPLPTLPFGRWKPATNP